jgi:HSP20 family molecular chaperone IbpA
MMSDITMEIEKKEAETPVGVERTRSRRTFIPQVDIYAAGDKFYLLADMPGVSQDNVDITLEKNQLTVRGRVEDQILEGYDALYAEYRVGDYERTFVLSDTVDRDQIEAVLKNGVLRLTLTKSEIAKARKIEVRSEV